MKLVDLNPNWVGHGGEGHFRRGEDGELVPIPERKRIGLSYDCPCGCGDRRYVPFTNPIDGLGPLLNSSGASWQRDGNDFKTLTLSPSIRHVPVEEGDCKWHGHITNGVIKTA